MSDEATQARGGSGEGEIGFFVCGKVAVTVFQCGDHAGFVHRDKACLFTIDPRACVEVDDVRVLGGPGVDHFLSAGSINRLFGMCHNLIDQPFFADADEASLVRECVHGWAVAVKVLCEFLKHAMNGEYFLHLFGFATIGFGWLHDVNGGEVDIE